MLSELANHATRLSPASVLKKWSAGGILLLLPPLPLVLLLLLLAEVAALRVLRVLWLPRRAGVLAAVLSVPRLSAVVVLALRLAASCRRFMVLYLVARCVACCLPMHL